MYTRALLLTGYLAFASAVLAGEPAPAFTSKPAVSKAGDKVGIAFEVSRSTDVAVYVLDASGKCIRHLAAGVLGGKNPPPAPLKAGLSQSLEWDGKDDAGKPAAGGPFKARVALGLRPEFDRMIGWNPALIGKVGSMATGPDGTLYVLSSVSGFGSGGGHGTVVAFDRSGKYLRMVAPYPSNLPEEKLKGIKRVEIAPGVRVPFIYNAETRAVFPGLGEPGMSRAVVTPQGRLILCGAMGVVRDRARYSQLISVNTDGSIPAEGVFGTNLESGVSLALAPGGKKLYAVGVVRGRGKKRKYSNEVYAFEFTDKAPKPLIKTGFNMPSGVATDKAGNIYVADKGNNRIAVFKPDGSVLGEFKSNRPVRIEVHPVTGAIYVLGGKHVNELRKYASWKDGKITAQANLPYYKNRYTAMMALDGSAEPPVLWFGSSSTWSKFKLLRVEDKGSAFGDQVDVGKQAARAAPSIGRPTDLVFTNGQIINWSQRGKGGPRAFDARSGKPVKAHVPRKNIDQGVGFIFEAGRDGNFYYLWGWSSARMERFDSALKPFPYPGRAKGAIPKLGCPRTRLRGLCVDRDGNAYVLSQSGPGDSNNVAKYGPDGKATNAKLVDAEIRSLNSVRLDPKGNIYLALGARAGGRMLPPHLEGKLPNSAKDPDAENGHNYYPLMYGSIVKFGPEGGTIRKQGEGIEAAYGYKRKVFIKDAKWAFFGASSVTTWTHGGMKPNICACESPRFDVDGFGRSFFGDACSFRVGVLDSAGNLIRWFGGYGNQDSAGPKSAIPTPEIPFGWVQAVAVDDEACFVGDRLNNRVVRVKLGYAAEETCALR